MLDADRLTGPSDRPGHSSISQYTPPRPGRKTLACRLGCDWGSLRSLQRLWRAEGRSGLSSISTAGRRNLIIRKTSTLAILAAGFLTVSTIAWAKHPPPRSYLMKCRGGGQMKANMRYERHASPPLSIVIHFQKARNLGPTVGTRVRSSSRRRGRRPPLQPIDTFRGH